MAIELTERAVSRIRELAMKRQTPEAFFRIGIRGGGCSGLSYFVDFADITIRRTRSSSSARARR